MGVCFFLAFPLNFIETLYALWPLFT